MYTSSTPTIRSSWSPRRCWCSTSPQEMPRPLPRTVANSTCSPQSVKSDWALTADLVSTVEELGGRPDAAAGGHVAGFKFPTSTSRGSLVVLWQPSRASAQPTKTQRMSLPFDRRLVQLFPGLVLVSPYPPKVDLGTKPWAVPYIPHRRGGTAGHRPPSDSSFCRQMSR